MLGPFLTQCPPGLPACFPTTRPYLLLCCVSPSSLPLVPSGLRTVKPGQVHPTSGATFSGHMAWSLAAPSDSPTLLAASVQASPPGSGARSPREDVSSLLWAQGPGSGTLSSPRFIYLSFVWGEIGENQIQWAVLAAVAGKKGMSVSPERIPCIVALAPRLGFGRQCPSFSLCPPARPRLPACLSAHGPWACRCPLDLAAGKEEKEMPWLLCPAWPIRPCRIRGEGCHTPMTSQISLFRA